MAPLNRVREVPDRVPVRRVLVSVSEKRELQKLVTTLLSIPDLVIYSTGGTYTRVCEIADAADAGRIMQVSEYTGQPEMQGGLVKTLDYKIYLGLLAEPGNEAHQADRERVGAELFDMVVVNLYPFTRVIQEPDSDIEDARSHIDIGGPSMLRAAAKSFLRVAAVCDPDDYNEICSELVASEGCLCLATRFRLALKTFKHTADYDRAIANYLAALPPGDLASAYRRMEDG
jgi:phosphoribosylaminoimidazolecarboxamide formyltransferase/IMP cyclohydrolase